MYPQDHFVYMLNRPEEKRGEMFLSRIAYYCQGS